MKAKHPMQPLIKDEHGTVRFKQNKIVRFLLDASSYDLNQLTLMPFGKADWEQFAQLIGYSLDRFEELHYVRPQTLKKAERQLQYLKEKGAI